MSNGRTIYLRNQKNIRVKKDGSFSRGDPVAVVISQVDFDAGEIKFAVASVHPSDNFIKSRARHIAIERLHTIDNDVDQTLPNDRGVLRGGMVMEAINSKSGHNITRLIMEEIEYLSSLPTSIRKVPTKIGRLASRWLKLSDIPKLADDQQQTIPAPAHRNAINPPPLGSALTYPLPRS